MTGAAFTIEWNDAPLRDAARRLMTFPDNRIVPMWQAIGHSLVSYTMMRFDDQRAPDGAAWKRSKRAIKDNGQTLILKGLLLASQTYNVLGKTGVEQGSNREYAAAMQFGADITMYARGQQIYRRTTKSGELMPGFVKRRKSNFASWVETPEYSIHVDARPYLGLSDANAAEITAIGQRHVEAAYLGARP